MNRGRHPSMPDLIIITASDLAIIRSYAVKIMSEFQEERHSIYDNDDIRTMCYVEATIMFMRSKNLIPFAFEYDQKDRS